MPWRGKPSVWGRQPAASVLDLDSACLNDKILNKQKSTQIIKTCNINWKITYSVAFSVQRIKFVPALESGKSLRLLLLLRSRPVKMNKCKMSNMSNVCAVLVRWQMSWPSPLSSTYSVFYIQTAYFTMNQFRIKFSTFLRFLHIQIVKWFCRRKLL